MEAQTIWKAVANAVSMVTVPAGALTLSTEPMTWWAWVLLAVGVAVQVAKYANEN